MSMPGIRKVAVIGAGVMGAGIAAQVANAGCDVLLLDIVPDGAKDRNGIAKEAIKRLLKTDPAPLMHKRNAKRITPGNLEDDLQALGSCDWIVEAVIEDPDIKRNLYRKLEMVRRPGSMVSSNTSTLRLSELTEGLPGSFAHDFMITHFFNPPRYMRLLELVPNPDACTSCVDVFRDFADKRLGKGVVMAKDTPGFIGNRIGIYWLQCAVIEAMEQHVTVEEADAVLGRPLGIPKTGVFGLLDMVGLDLMPHVLGSMARALPDSDPFHEIDAEPALLKTLIAEGYTGRKGKGGFYRLDRRDSRKVKQALDLETGTYRDSHKPRLDSVQAARKLGPRGLLDHPSHSGRYARRVMLRTLSYAASLVPEIADAPDDVDRAMRLGYNWDKGPFELIDQLSPAWLRDALAAEHLPVPKLLREIGEGRFYGTAEGALDQHLPNGSRVPVPRPHGALLLSDVKRRSKPLATNRSASLWDVGDGVACLEFHSKMNSIDPWTLGVASKATRLLPERGLKALVVHNEAPNFSVGANIGLVVLAARAHLWFLIEAFLKQGQRVLGNLKRAPFPVVGAPSGMALGGGCETLLHCDAVQAHAETYMGLVEAGVGIVPGWGGCKEMLLRHAANEEGPHGPMQPVLRAFETIAMAKVAKSADEARDLGFLGPADGITMNRDRLLADAKEKALLLAEGYEAPLPGAVQLPGETGRVALGMAIDGYQRQGLATPHDVTVAESLARVLSGGDTDITHFANEADLLALERQANMCLARTPQTGARMRHMLETGKPLRN